MEVIIFIIHLFSFTVLKIMYKHIFLFKYSYVLLENICYMFVICLNNSCVECSIQHQYYMSKGLIQLGFSKQLVLRAWNTGC